MTRVQIGANQIVPRQEFREIVRSDSIGKRHEHASKHRIQRIDKKVCLHFTNNWLIARDVYASERLKFERLFAQSRSFNVDYQLEIFANLRSCSIVFAFRVRVRERVNA